MASPAPSRNRASSQLSSSSSHLQVTGQSQIIFHRSFSISHLSSIGHVVRYVINPAHHRLQIDKHFLRRAIRHAQERRNSKREMEHDIRTIRFSRVNSSIHFFNIYSNTSYHS